jgi:hypothetical protein
VLSKECSTNKENNTYRLLVGNPEGNRPLGWQRRRWVDNIKMDHGEMGCGGIDWIDLAPDGDQWKALVNEVMIFRVS